MNHDGTFQSGPARVSVTGLNRTLRALEQAGADAQDMKNLMHELGMIVVRATNVPQDSGRLKATLRAGKGKTKAVVRIGGARAPYAGVVHYGTREDPQVPFLVNALRAKRAELIRRLEAGLNDILRKNNLK